MIGDVLAVLASIGLMLGAVVTHPKIATCPHGWWLGEGVRTSGEFACYSPLALDCEDPTGIYEGVLCPPISVVRSAIYCTNGMRAIVINSRTVGCQR